MIQVYDDKCDYCGICVAVCPVDSIELRASSLSVLDHCILCDLCVYACPYEALAAV